MELLAVDFSAVLAVLSVGIVGAVAMRVIDSFAKRRVQERTRNVLNVWRRVE